jgi:hypothetical protein
MAAPLRFIPEEAKLWTDQKGRPIAIAEVTIRTIQGRYLMKPTPENTDLLPSDNYLSPRSMGFCPSRNAIFTQYAG